MLIQSIKLCINDIDTLFLSKIKKDKPQLKIIIFDVIS